jgi:hypothetical protein
MNLFKIKSESKQRIASIIWPKYLRVVELANANAMLRKWTIQHPNISSFPNRKSYFSHIANTVTKDSVIDYLEFGVYYGESLAIWASLNDNPSSRFFGFDTFSGLPEDWKQDFKKGAFNTSSDLPNIEDQRVKFIKGLFQDTLAEFLIKFQRKNQLIIHMDADLYTSTLHVLTNINNILRKGDIIMFDEFAYPLGEFKAYIDFTSSFRIDLEPIAMVNRTVCPDQIAFKVR